MPRHSKITANKSKLNMTSIDFGKVAQKLILPYKRNDLIISDSIQRTIDNFIQEGKDRKLAFSSERKISSTQKALIALFSGEPGTGKTMAAQVIAAQLGLDLYRIDLSSVVNKYIGETEKNLNKIFIEAETSNAILLFDEADALFGNRIEVKDSHDHYANIDINHLLKVMENYQGIAILTTNKKESIDSGFIRSLRYVLEFPRPDVSQREQIWKKYFPKSLIKSNAEQIPELANYAGLTGGQKKKSIIKAKLIARNEMQQLKISHLIDGMERVISKD